MDELHLWEGSKGAGSQGCHGKGTLGPLACRSRDHQSGQGCRYRSSSGSRANKPMAGLEAKETKLCLWCCLYRRQQTCIVLFIKVFLKN